MTERHDASRLSSRAGRVRWCYQRARAGWRRRHQSQCRWWARGWLVWVSRVCRRRGSATANRTRPGSSGGSWSGGWRGQGGAPVADSGGGARADRQGGHGQGELADDGLVAADLAVVEGELVLADLDGPAHTGDGDQRTQRGRVAYGDVAAEVGLVGGVDQDAADQLAVVGAGAP